MMGGRPPGVVIPAVLLLASGALGTGSVITELYFHGPPYAESALKWATPIAKPMPDHAHYELVLNHDVAPELRPIGHLVLVDPAAASACRSAIVQRLVGLAPAAGRTTVWCVDRLVIRIESRRANELEAVAVTSMSSSEEVGACRWSTRGLRANSFTPSRSRMFASHVRQLGRP
ncbi:MAG TPA: hypothetical protein DEV93_19610 [Chloroflexi bacterium]|jgi:hypothetical protein|nr:hypothetical protein [Chloroflexota bacterium]